MAQFNVKANVSISCGTANATIKYTLDGTEPSASVGEVYSSQFTLYKNTTVKAIAIKDGLLDSDIASNDITVKIPFESSYIQATDNGDSIVYTLTEAAKTMLNNYGSSTRVKFASGGTVFGEMEIAGSYTLTENKSFTIYVTSSNNVNSDSIEYTVSTLKVKTPIITVV